MSKRSKQPKNYFKLATWLLVAGISLIAVSLFISLLFIQGTNFKHEYRAKQYQQCLDKSNPVADCKKSFGE